MRFVAVTKAVKRTPRRAAKGTPTGDYEALQRIADELAPRFSARVTSTIDTFRAKIDLRDVLSALAYEDVSRVEGMIPWQDLLDQDEFLRFDIEHAVKSAGISSMTDLRKVLERTAPEIAAQAAFDRRSSSIEAFARERSSDLIREITDASRNAVREIIGDVLSQSRGFEAGARAIQDAVGLTTNQAQATLRFRNSLMDQGMPDAIVDRRTDSYRDRQLRRRSETIARTETIRASNQGQLETWNQAADAGLIDKGTAVKVWIVTPDDRLCDICEPMDGVAVGLDEPFKTDEGDVDAPPLHPNCRCATTLRFQKGEDDEGE